MTLKTILYDLFGYNIELFNAVHNFWHDEIILIAAKILSNYLGEYLFFPAHFAVLIGVILYNKGKPRAEYYKVFLMLVCSYCSGAVIVELAKIYFKFPRPYCNIALVNLNQAVQAIAPFNMAKCFKSLPSGHAYYVVTFVFSIWNILNGPLKFAGILLIALVCLSRIMLGMHFPSDIIYGCVIALIVTGVVKVTVEKFWKKF